jgi:succinoglycan biosynthesis protein ExoM
MIIISICICTRNRQEGLKSLLVSLENMQKPPDTDVRIIVVENDVESRSEKIVNEIFFSSKIKINYFLETNKGISFARNRSVKEAQGSDFCCFIDDDQIADSNWLKELLKCQREFNADGVWGPNPPIFNKKAPLYIQQFYTPKKFNYGSIVSMAYTNCLLLRKKYLDKIEGPFDLRLNFTGGEDIYLTYIISNIGGVIRYNPNAIAYEIISTERTTINYIIKRVYRNSNISYFIQSLIKGNINNYKGISRLFLRFGLGLLIMVPLLLFGKSDKLKGLIKIINSIGGFSFLLGKKNHFYK